MNDLLFIALLIALLYYFFIYLPSQKKLNPDPDNKPFTHPKPKKETEIKFPSAEYEPGPTLECPGAISQRETQELENTLDYLINGMDELSQDLDKY
jgi:hypothetical protein